MPAPFLTANDVKLDLIADGGIAIVNGYDNIPLSVKVSAKMSDTHEIIANNIPELCAKIAEELNKQFEAPITYTAKDDCAGWSNRATWKVALLFSSNRTLYRAKRTFFSTLEATRAIITPESVMDFVKDTVACISPEAIFPDNNDTLSCDGVNWVELSEIWAEEYSNLHK